MNQASGRLLAVAGLLALVVMAAGCAPTYLGDRQFEGTHDEPLLGCAGDCPEYGTATLVSEGENLSVTINMPDGENCVGNFQLTKVEKGYPVIAWFTFGALPSSGYTVYTGNFQSNMSSQCVELLYGPGDMTRTAILHGDETISFCDGVATEEGDCLTRRWYVLEETGMEST